MSDVFPNAVFYIAYRFRFINRLIQTKSIKFLTRYKVSDLSLFFYICYVLKLFFFIINYKILR